MITLELKKLQRCSILWVGSLTMICAPLLAILQLFSMNEPISNYGFNELINATIWYNMSLFLPVPITLLGGYMINREYVDDMFKNLLTIPITYRKLMFGKIGALMILNICYCAYSFIVTTILSIIFFPTSITGAAVIYSLLRVSCMGICICIAMLPIIVWCGGKKNRFLAGSVIAFLYGFFSIPIAGHNLQDIYPVSAGLSIIQYNGDIGSNATIYHPEIAISVLLITLIITYIVLCIQNPIK